ncbi:exopolysaccharide biosynthesis polyprenyl glycosylphosphotransferase [Parendozoicomonas haliclonae]|uniref:UDP-N-acetylgalactosamine-undecaprenyl-phosphate N-acetylgalactosaminephosphotransferase n=1 Tax=Parendozoicomonas haliclonae TaxID=1960125 RepID=A0A1X7ADI0_9GAMM|nr:exopolysaccharide biosynthesis polyprenyl glycosylphosphotransferase [Parendozoicomonas haliclonae]SMA31341.1 UDP-N-acetylgalactosamine-undecaprenyl-phosphate N-acetylgalactosaminephosphotransferase [Parendozoicomonas haliclonae]
MNILNTSKYKRFDRLYEKLLYTQLTRNALGVLFIVLTTSFFFVMRITDIWLSDTKWNALVTVVLVYLISDIGISIVSKYPGVHRLKYAVPISLAVGAVALMVILLLRIDYSRSTLIISFLSAFFYIVFSSAFVHKYRRPKVAVVPCGKIDHLFSIPDVAWRPLKEPVYDGVRYDAVAVDFPALTAEWDKFVSDVSLQGRASISTDKLFESLTGRVNTQHISPGSDGGLIPSSFYSLVKRTSDICIALLAAPVVVPVVLIAAVIVKLESPGSAFFTQNRVGKGGKEFKIYKLRSMCKNSEENGAQFAASGDARVTRFGHFIRKTRIDELPQFLNILKGDMSLIGPRPEQKVFVLEFEKSIPFYGYRHVVRPGITGWAQVTHGYAGSEDETRLKLEHDLYYIKNFSLWLDILIVFKTIHTMLTGFGAR